MIDLALRIAGGVVLTVLAAVSALYEAFLTPLYWQAYRLPLALLLAFAGNAALAWLTRDVTGRAVAVLAPAAVWFLVMLGAAVRTTEGDLVLFEQNWVAFATLFGGAIAYAAPGYWMVHAALRRPRVLP